MAPFQAIYRRDRKWEFEDSHHGRNMRPEEGSLVDNIRCMMGLVFGAGGAVRPSSSVLCTQIGGVFATGLFIDWDGTC